jgi:hypothetical protein
MQTQEITVTATLVPEDERLDVLPYFFNLVGIMNFENALYDWMARLSEGYAGGYWEFYRTSNGGFFMAPGHHGSPMTFKMESPNGRECAVSREVAGIVASLFALCEMHQFLKVEDAYHMLHHYAADHKEAAAILGLID